LHPAVEGPHGKDEDPELHGTSGRGLLAMLRIKRVYKEKGVKRCLVGGEVAE